MRKKGIAFKTFIFSSLLITIVTILSYGTLYAIMPGYYRYLKETRLEKDIAELLSFIEECTDENDIAERINSVSAENNALIYAMKDNNTIIVFSLPGVDNANDSRYLYSSETTDSYTVAIPALPEEVHIRTFEFLPSFKTSPNAAVGFTINNDSSVQEFTVNSNFADKIIVQSSLQPIDEAQNVILKLFPFVLGFDLLIIIFASYFFSRYFTRPIIAISKTAEQMQSLEPDLSCNYQSADELGTLSRNLDSLYSGFRSSLEDLKSEMEKTGRLEQAKTDFMRAASHELKTPIAALNAITEGMIDNMGKYKDRSLYLQESKKQISRLSALVDEILNASKMDLLEEYMMEDRVYINELIENLLEDYKSIIKEKNLVLKCSLTEYEITTNENLFLNGISNIISNAVKYTPVNGEIEITMESGNGNMTLIIENECEKISSKDLDNLFDPFYTLDYSRNKGGTGLGLYIVKKSLQSLNIDFSLESVENTVKFTMYI